MTLNASVTKHTTKQQEEMHHIVQFVQLHISCKKNTECTRVILQMTENYKCFTEIC